jgi:hypothetical protein
VTLSLVEEGRVGGTTFNLLVDGFDPALAEFRYTEPSTIRSAPLRVWAKSGRVCGRVSS